MLSRIWKLFFAIVLLLVIVFAISAYQFFVSPLSVANDVKIRMHNGDRVPQLVQKLISKNALGDSVINKISFRFWMRVSGAARHLQVGEYLLTQGMSANDLRKKVISGDVVVYKITFVEGTRFVDMLKQLQNNMILKHKLSGLDSAAIMQQLGHAQLHPEGRFFPSTYSYRWGDSDLKILSRAFNKMQQVLAEEWAKRKTGLWYKKPAQALIVASLIEAETAKPNERTLIAGVILNRLQQVIRLQIDPTVMYGLGYPFGTALTKRDLRKKTAYNTYTFYGLPPTPIDMPGRACIHAALNPDVTGYLYYVSRNDGSHVFSKTYAEHRKAVNIFQKKKSLNKTKSRKINER